MSQAGEFSGHVPDSGLNFLLGHLRREQQAKAAKSKKTRESEKTTDTVASHDEESAEDDERSEDIVGRPTLSRVCKMVLGSTYQGC